MKEFNSTTGGRYVYADDIFNLQNIGLALESLFDECPNFIISGCVVSRTSVSDGYVYINGKVRRFNGASGIGSWPVYIFESNNVESVDYADKQSKIGRVDYGCAIGVSVPSSNDPVTGNSPQYIRLDSDGKATRIADAFFGSYCLLLQSSRAQLVQGGVSFSGPVEFNREVSHNDTVSLREIRNNKSDLTIMGKSSVDIGPKILENGVELDEKYMAKREIKDTGWILVQPPGLYARQFGKVVTVQGAMVALRDGELQAILPKSIDAPGKDFDATVYSRIQLDGVPLLAILSMQSGSRDIRMSYCHPKVCGNEVNVLITYMV